MFELDLERKESLQPQRLSYAKSELYKLGYMINYEDSTKIKFDFNGESVTLFAYAGWHTGRSIKDGRGINKLLKQIK